MNVLQVIDQAFRTTTEEQDDTILWLTRSMRGAGGNLSLLLAGHAVYYAALRQRHPPLSIGEWRQTQPAELTKDMAELMASGVPIYAVKEDLDERGLGKRPLISGVKAITRSSLPNIYQQADQVWHW